MKKDNSNLKLTNYVQCTQCGFTLFDQRVIIRIVDVVNEQTNQKQKRHALFPAFTCAQCGSLVSLTTKPVESEIKLEE